VIEYLKNNESIEVHYCLKESPEFNAVEECWRPGKYHLIVSKYYPKFEDLISSISKYYMTNRFNLDIVKYLSRKVK
jgi:hypothetical protein